MAKRISASSVDWARLYELVPASDKALLSMFKSKMDKHLKVVSSLPAELPKIDWNYYKAKIPNPKLVETFQKGYESVKVPYPSDKGYIDKLTKDEAVKFKTFKDIESNINKKLDELNAELKKLQSVKQYSEMTIEELYIARPDLAVTPENPRLWPQYLPDESSKAPTDEH